jgi:3-methyladenine DNA glycosylase Mpg
MAVNPMEITTARRIGISRAVHTPWQFLHAGSGFLSRPA